MQSGFQQTSNKDDTFWLIRMKNLLLILMLVLAVCHVKTERLPQDQYCGTYRPGMGYSIKCGSCFCTSKGRPLCKRIPSFECSLEVIQSHRYPNKCGKGNLGKPALDGCNFLRCGTTPGGSFISTRVACDNRESKCKQHKPGYTYYAKSPPYYWRCDRCVCTAGGMPWCVNKCKEHPYYPNPNIKYCSRYTPGRGFFDKDTCQKCICTKRGLTVCNRQTTLPKNWKIRCVPKVGAKLTNVCGSVSFNKEFYDGCNTGLCGSAGTWPIKRYTRSSCAIAPKCRRWEKAGVTYSHSKKPGKVCVCSISGVLVCQR